MEGELGSRKWRHNSKGPKGGREKILIRAMGRGSMGKRWGSLAMTKNMKRQLQETGRTGEKIYETLE